MEGGGRAWRRGGGEVPASKINPLQLHGIEGSAAQVVKMYGIFTIFTCVK